MRLNIFHAERCIEIEIASRNRDDGVLCPLCSSFPYGLVNLHKFSACIIPVSFCFIASFQEFRRRKINFSRRFAFLLAVLCWSSVLQSTSLKRWIAFVWALRLGFDLFSHSFHNLIKRLWFCCATEVEDGLRNNKGKSPFMDEGAWKDEHLHCVPTGGQMLLHLCIAYISRGGLHVAFSRICDASPLTARSH